MGNDERRGMRRRHRMERRDGAWPRARI